MSAARLYSLNYSVVAEADSGQRFKLLFQQNAFDNECEEILDAFEDFLTAYHEGNLSPEMLEKLGNARVVSRTMLLAFDLKSKVLEPIDPFPQK